MQEDPRYAFANALLKGGSVLQHEITHSGRDHLMTTEVDDGCLMIANVHLEPTSTLGS